MTLADEIRLGLHGAGCDPSEQIVTEDANPAKAEMLPYWRTQAFRGGMALAAESPDRDQAWLMLLQLVANN